MNNNSFEGIEGKKFYRSLKPESQMYSTREKVVVSRERNVPWHRHDLVSVNKNSRLSSGSVE